MTNKEQAQAALEAIKELGQAACLFELGEHNYTIIAALESMAGDGVIVAEHSNAEKAIIERAIDRMGWDEIHAFHNQKEQSVYEDAGGYILRKIKALFGIPVPDNTIFTYKEACKAMLSTTEKTRR